MNNRLHEKASSAADARKRGLALYVGKDGYEKMYMLYDADKLIEYVSNPKFIKNPFVTNLEMKLAKHCAIASILVGKKTGKKWNASEIATSAAQEGYGPLLYDIVMELEQGLMADRSSVSPSAKNVWDYYLNNRGDVEAKKLDDEDNPKTRTKKDDAYVFDSGDDENPLNYAYFIKKGPAVTSLLNNHDRCVAQLKKLHVSEYVEFGSMGTELFFWKFKA